MSQPAYMTDHWLTYWLYSKGKSIYHASRSKNISLPSELCPTVMWYGRVFWPVSNSNLLAIKLVQFNSRVPGRRFTNGSWVADRMSIPAPETGDCLHVTFLVQSFVQFHLLIRSNESNRMHHGSFLSQLQRWCCLHGACFVPPHSIQ
jgi:hypothetical protein